MNENITYLLYKDRPIGTAVILPIPYKYSCVEFCFFLTKPKYTPMSNGKARDNRKITESTQLNVT